MTRSLADTAIRDPARTVATANTTAVPPLGWRQIGGLLACVFGMATSCLAFTAYAVGPFIYPLTHAFGWSRQEILLAPSVLSGVTLCLSFAVGWLTDRVSALWLAVPSQIAFGVCFFALAIFTNGNIWLFYALHFLMATLAAGTLPIVFNRIVAVSFQQNRGLAMGVMLTGSGLCGLCLPPYLTWLIAHFGWRMAYIGLGMVPIGGAMLISLPLLPRIRPLVQHPPVDTNEPHVPLKRVLRDRRFCTMAVVFFVGSGLSTSIISNMIPFLRDQGVTPMAAAEPLSIFGLAVIAGRIGIGFLVDRLWAPPVAACVMLPAAATLVFMANHSIHAPAAIICAIFLGLAAGAEADMLSFLPTKYFGIRLTGQIYAILYIFFVAGIGVIGPLFGWAYDRFHSYTIPFMGAATGWVLCSLLLVSLGGYPKAKL